LERYRWCAAAATADCSLAVLEDTWRGTGGLLLLLQSSRNIAADISKTCEIRISLFNLNVLYLSTVTQLVLRPPAVHFTSIHCVYIFGARGGAVG